MANRWLICGGRDFDDWEMFDAALRSVANNSGVPWVVIHGAAKGADRMADRWVQEMRAGGVDIQLIRVPADWERHGRHAGPIRNQQMLDEHKPDLVIAFPGGRGTADMVSRAKAAEITVIEPKGTQGGRG